MKTLAAILLSVGIMLVANTNSQALTFDFEGLIPKYTIFTSPTGLAVKPIASSTTTDLDNPGLDWDQPSEHDHLVPTPEPATLLLLGSGLLCVGWTTRKAKRKLS